MTTPRLTTAGGSLADERAELLAAARRKGRSPEAAARRRAEWRERVDGGTVHTPAQQRGRGGWGAIIRLAVPTLLPGTAITVVGFAAEMPRPLPKWLADHIAATEAKPS